MSCFRVVFPVYVRALPAGPEREAGFTGVFEVKRLFTRGRGVYPTESNNNEYRRFLPAIRNSSFLVFEDETYVAVAQLLQLIHD